MSEKKNLKDIVDATAEVTKKGVATVKDKTELAYKKAVEVLDENGDGEVNIEDVILISLKTPGIKVNREKFLRKEFGKVCDKKLLPTIIAKNAMAAGVDQNIIDHLADDTIQFERNCVSGISAALSMPGGVAMVATIPTDIAQYYGYMLRAAQKLMYLYGFPEIIADDDDLPLDTATINTLTLCLGVMFGVSGANKALRSMAAALGEGISKKLLRKALTKGKIYPIVKSVASWFGKRMTKEVFAGFFKKALPVVGGIVGGGITYATFKPCCDRLKSTLKETALNNPNTMDNDVIIAEYFDIEE